MFGVRVAPAHEEPRSGSNNSEHESTSGRSTNYESGHLIRVFRDIGRIFSLLFLLSHPLPVGHRLRKRVQKRKTEYGFVEGKNGFNCISCGTRRAERRILCQNENPAGLCEVPGRGLGNPQSSAARIIVVMRAPLGKHASGPEVPHGTSGTTSSKASTPASSATRFQDFRNQD
jgi:hypothetical protein